MLAESELQLFGQLSHVLRVDQIVLAVLRNLHFVRSRTLTLRGWPSLREQFLLEICKQNN